MKYSLLIVNYKSKQDVLMLLEDIHREFFQQEYEVIIVENFSGDVFPEDIPRAKILYSNVNLGFGKGMNLAASHAVGEYFVLVNPDCRLSKGQSFDKFVMDNKFYDFGVLSPLILYPDGRVQPNRGGRSNLNTYLFQLLRLGRLKQFFPRFLLHLEVVKKSIVGKYLDNFVSVPEVAFPDWLSGAFMVIPGTLFNEVSGFDPKIFMYCEDEDLCIRIAQKGKKIVFSSSYRVIHEVGGTQKTGEVQRLKFSEVKRLESNIYYLSKNGGYPSAVILKYIYAVAYFFFSLRFRKPLAFLRISKHFFSFKIP